MKSVSRKQHSLRRSAMLTVLPLAGVACVFGALTLSAQPMYDVVFLIITILGGLVAFAMMGAILSDNLSVESAATWFAILFFAFTSTRALTFFVHEDMAAGPVSVMLPIYAMVSLAFVLTSVCLDSKRALRINVVGWLSICLSFSCGAFVLSPASPESMILLGPTMLMLWAIYPGIWVLGLAYNRNNERIGELYEQQLTRVEDARSEASEFASQLDGILNNATTGIGALNRDGLWVKSNAVLHRMTGYSATELGRMRLSEVTHPEDLREHLPLFEKLKNHELDRYKLEQRFIQKSGESTWVDLSIGRLAGETRPEDQFVVVATDISDEKLAQQQLQALNSSLEASVKQRTHELEKSNRILSGLSHFCALVQHVTSEAELAELCKSVLPELTGSDHGILLLLDSSSGELTTLVRWGDLHEFRGKSRECWSVRKGHRHFTQGATSNLVCDHMHEDRDRMTGHVCQPLFSSGRLIGVLTVATAARGEAAECWFRDESMQALGPIADYVATKLETLRLTANLAETARTDALTQLLNRRPMEEHLRLLEADADRLSQPFSLLMIDIDRFKAINDQHGHGTGDRVLRLVAETIQRCIRESDKAYRYGGEEFVVIMNQTSTEGALLAAENIRHSICNVQVIDQSRKVPTPTVSIGVATYSAALQSGKDLLEAADRRLYAAKQNGRNCVNAGPNLAPVKHRPTSSPGLDFNGTD